MPSVKLRRASFYTQQKNGRKYYVIRFGRKPNGKPETKTYSQGEEAARDEWIVQYNKALDLEDKFSIAHLSKEQVIEINHCYQKIAGTGKTLFEIVSDWVEKNNPISYHLPISEAVERAEAAMAFRGVSPRNIEKTHRSVYKPFIKYLKNKPLGKILKQDCKEFITGKTTRSFATKKNYLTNLNNLFNTLNNEGLTMPNPCEKISLGESVAKTPSFYEPWEMYLFLQTCALAKKTKVLHANFMAAYMGIRLEETTRITVEQLQGYQKEFYVRVDKTKTKKRRKIVKPFNYWPWMRTVGWEARKRNPTEKIATLYSIEDGSAAIRKICSEVEFPTSKTRKFTRKQNLCRQSFACYHFSYFEDKTILVDLMGNSKDTLEKNYDGLDEKKYAKYFWHLIPSKLYKEAVLYSNKIQSRHEKALIEYKKLAEENKPRRLQNKKWVFIDMKKLRREQLQAADSGILSNEARDELFEKSKIQNVSEEINKIAEVVNMNHFHFGWDITDDSKTVKVLQTKNHLEQKFGCSLEELDQKIIEYLSKK